MNRDCPQSNIRIKRIYEDADPDDGQRVLVDRIWPRGVTKEKAQLKLWMKEVTPSTELRTWFQHDAKKFEEFTRRYKAELSDKLVQPYLRQLLTWSTDHTVTLLYAAKNEHCNHALVLKQYLDQHAN
jgi:uncharacterized protein YeaO (DUF488 family)